MLALCIYVLRHGLTSVDGYDLQNCPAPAMDGVGRFVVVRAPGSLHPPRAGCVLVEHLTGTGRDDRIESPTADAVPLFWRFMIEKFGVHPATLAQGD